MEKEPSMHKPGSEEEPDYMHDVDEVVSQKETQMIRHAYEVVYPMIRKEVVMPKDEAQKLITELNGDIAWAVGYDRQEYEHYKIHAFPSGGKQPVIVFGQEMPVDPQVDWQEKPGGTIYGGGRRQAEE